MPRNHPIFGVPVMTLEEFWQSEAKRQGKPVHELYESFQNDLQQNIQEEQNKLFDVNVAQQHLDDAIASYEPEPDALPSPTPEKVTEVLHAEYGMTFNSERTRIIFRAYCDDESLRVFQISAFSFAGSFYEPPDYSIELEEWDEQNIPKEHQPNNSILQ